MSIWVGMLTSTPELVACMKSFPSRVKASSFTCSTTFIAAGDLFLKHLVTQAWSNLGFWHGAAVFGHQGCMTLRAEQLCCCRRRIVMRGHAFGLMMLGIAPHKQHSLRLNTQRH